jgi:hypothetical protein
MGKIHAARIKDSKRHQRILELFKDAWHPLSSQDIAKTAYPRSDDLMLNVSTNIGEMRSQENQNDGYVVSFATKWLLAPKGMELHKTVAKDGKGVTFYISEIKYPWHDGRQRYWLVAAPGWVPRWRVDDYGNVVSCTSGQRAEIRVLELGVGSQNETIPESDPLAPRPWPLDPAVNPTGPGTPCQLPRCGRPIPAGKPETTKFCCTAHHDEFHKNIKEMGKETARAIQGGLFG